MTIELEIKVDTSKFDRFLADIPAALGRAQRNALHQVGNTVKNRAVESFRDPELRPAPWAPRKNDADPDRPLLYKSGNLKQSIGYRLAGTDAVKIGTPHLYGMFHQTGTKNMPARPFYPVKDGELVPDVRETIVRKVEKAYADELERALGSIGVGRRR